MQSHYIQIYKMMSCTLQYFQYLNLKCINQHTCTTHTVYAAFPIQLSSSFVGMYAHLACSSICEQVHVQVHVYMNKGVGLTVELAAVRRYGKT